MDKSTNFAITIIVSAFSAIFALFGAVIVGVLVYYMERVDDTISKTNAEITEIKIDVAVLKSDVSVLKDDVAILKNDVGNLKINFSKLESDNLLTVQ